MERTPDVPCLNVMFKNLEAKELDTFITEKQKNKIIK